jgi:hypothetical protein
MFKKIGIFLAAVMLVALGAGSAFAVYGDNFVDGMATGTVHGNATNVYINPQGTGDALVYGYYNVRGGMANLFTLTNTSSSYGVRARVRFLEAKHSCEVRDFDVCLSPNDVWTAYILNNNGVANLNVIDSDTAIDTANPRGSIAGTLTDLFPDGIDFAFGTSVQCKVNTDPTADNPSGVTSVPITSDDTLEGYFIVIAENQLSETAVDDSQATTCGVKGVNGAAKTLVDDLGSGSVDNVLFGNDYSIDLLKGTTYAYNATAIGDFSDTVFTQDPTNAAPDFSNGTDGIVGLNFALTKSMLAGSYYDIGNGTEMVVTFPTRRLSTAPATGDDIFDDSRVAVTAFDTAENSKTVVCQLSPCPPSQAVELPYEVNVVSINKAKLFDSTVEVPISIDYALGWLNLDLVNALTGTPAGPLAHETTTNGQTSNGLPAIGYVATQISSSGWNWMVPMIYNTSVVGD